MKTNVTLLMVVFTLLTFQMTSAQKDKKSPCEPKNECTDNIHVFCTVVIDLDHPETIKLPKDIKPGQYYNVVVKNVNLNNYFVQINNEDSNVSTAVELPVFGNLSFDNIAKLTAAFNSSTSITSNPDFNNMEQYMMISGSKIKFKSDETDEQLIMKKLDDFKVRLVSEVEKIKAANVDLDKEKMTLYEYRLQSNSEKGVDGSYNFNKALENFKKLRDDAETIKLDIKNLNKEFEDYIKGKEEGISNVELKKNLVTLRKMFEESSKTASDFKELINADNVEKLLLSILNLTANKCFVSAPIQFTKEQTKLKVDLKPKAEKSPLPTYNFGPYLFPVDFKTYWSVGTVFYYANGLTNERYSSIGTTVGNTTTYRIIEEDEINNELGIAALLRYGKKSESSDWGRHFSVGTGLSIEKSPKPRLLIGGGLSYGKKHNFTFDLGLIAGYTDTKSKVIDLNTVYTEKPSNITVTKLKAGAFVSFGYMFKIN
jgi:hypothetical protein